METYVGDLMVVVCSCQQLLCFEIDAKLSKEVRRSW